MKKFATAEIVDVRFSPTQVSDLSASDFQKLAKPNNAISPQGYLYVQTRAISSRVNKNHDGWPSEELAKAYHTFEGRPIFVDHNNDDPERTRGVVIWSKLHVDDEKTSGLDPYYATAPDNHKPPTWIDLMLEVDAKEFPKLAEHIISGKINAVSMGANIDMSKCSVCGQEASEPSQYCSHIQKKGAEFEVTSADGTKTKKKAYEDCHGINFFEISFVFDPADETALISQHSPEQIKDAREAIASYEAAGVKAPDELYAIAKVAVGPMDRDLQQPTRNVERQLNHEPQADKVTAPAEVDTLAPDVVCRNCGSDMEQDSTGMYVCPQCGFEMEPQGFDNPDLEQAQKIDLRQDQTEQMNPEGEQQTELEADKGETDIAQKNPNRSPIRPVAPISSKSTTDVTDEMKFATAQTEVNAGAVKSAVEYLAKNGGPTDPSKLCKLLRSKGITASVLEAAAAVTSHKAKLAVAQNPNNQKTKKVILDNASSGKSAPAVVGERVKSDQLAPVEATNEADMKKNADRETIVRTEEDGSGTKRTEEITKEYGPMAGGEETDPEAQLSEDEEGEELEDEQLEGEENPDESGEQKPYDLNNPQAQEEEDEMESEEKVPAMASVEDPEAKLMARLTLAKTAAGLGVIAADDELNFVAELEAEGLDQIKARSDMLERVKAAGLTRKQRRAPVLAGRFPSLRATSTSHASLDDIDSIPDESLYM